MIEIIIPILIFFIFPIIYIWFWLFVVFKPKKQNLGTRIAGCPECGKRDCGCNVC